MEETKKLTKEEWLKSHEYVSLCVFNSSLKTNEWEKHIDIDGGYDLEIDLKSNTYSVYSWKELNTFGEKEINLLNKLFLQVKEDYETMIKECEE